MRKTSFLLTLMAIAAPGCVTHRPGAELIGHSLRVEAPRGPATILSFAADGTVTGSSGGNEARGNWQISGQQICVTFERTGRECFPYTRAFRRGETITVTGTSGVSVRATLL
jgi:hypothetical protein